MQQDAVVAEFGAGIAIIGMGCVLPAGIKSPQALWTFLCDGRDGICEVPADRWNNDAVFSPDPGTPGKTPTKWGGFITDIAEFDAGFFGISPREAAVMDPQQRMLLEVAWRALEDAGMQIEALSGSSTGVYIGISHSDYHGIQKFGRPDIDLHTSTGGALSIAANRLSHRFNLRGPSLSVDTACSSSLVALDLACAAIRSGACDMALCGGVNAILTPDVTITFSRASMLSPDGRCKAFDSRANGYVRGEGAGMVVLKPISRAIADGDRIHAVIRATAVNQDGRTTTITVPSLEAQMEMLQEACRRAAIDPSAINYVEAHGTGTAVGDPIEAEAIGRVFGKNHGGENKCLIGSIKTNIGHLEPAAGIAGLIKATLCVEQGKVPPNLHFQNPNPNIHFDELGIEVCRRLSPFPEEGSLRLVAVNSFGFGGTNACAIVQQPPMRVASGEQLAPLGWPTLLPLSAPSRNSLEVLAGDLAETLERGSISLADASGTLALRRSHLEHRVVVLADALDQAAAGFRSFAHKEPRSGVVSGRRGPPSRLAFVFTGQGAHWWGMGRGLLENDSVFRKAVEECDEIFRSLSGWSLISELRASEDRSRMDYTVVAQPTTFALQVGLAARWKAWGIEPEAAIGHSIGEMAAAYIAGGLTLEDTVTVVYHRSRLQEQTRLQGGMAAIGLSAEETHKLLDQMQIDLEIAAVNAPELVTVAGPRGEVERLIGELKVTHDDVFARMLRVDYAFHSRQMDPFEAELRANLKSISPQRPVIPFYSTVTGVPAEAGELDADYWWRNMRRAVVFRSAIEAAITDGFNTFVELGAHAVLAGPVRSCLAHADREGTVVGSLHRDEQDQDYIARSLAELHVAGVPIEWERVVPRNWDFVEVPRQRFERSVFWSESEESQSARFDGPVHPLLGYRLKTAVPTWQAQVSAETHRFLQDHVVDGSVVFPAAGYVELILAAARETIKDTPWELESIAFHDALILSKETISFVQTSVDPMRGVVEVKSRLRNRDTGWDLHASGRIRAWSGPEPQLKPWRPEIEPPAHFERARFYRQLRSEGHEFGPAFQGVDTIFREHGQVLGIIKLPTEVETAEGYLLHPSMLDSCFQVIRGFRDFDDANEGEQALALPISIDRVRFFRMPGATVFSRAEAIEDTDTKITADISVIDGAGRLVALIDGFCCRRVARPKQEQAAEGPSLYAEQWIELAPPDAADAPAGQDGTWMIFTDRGGIGAGLAERLAQAGIASIQVTRGGGFCQIDEGHFEAAADVRSLTQVLEAAEPEVARIVYLWALDASLAPVSGADIAQAQQSGSEALIALMKAATGAGLQPRLAVATAGTVTVDDQPGPPGQNLLHASLIGVVRSIGNEFPYTKPVVVDLDPDHMSADALYAELADESGEAEIAIRADTRYGARLVRVGEDEVPLRRIAWDAQTRSPAFRLTMRSPGVIDNLLLREIMDVPLARGEVVVEVHATGLNFRDIMAATGLLPAEAEVGPAWERLGFECAGIVRDVGDGVDRRLIGKRVAAVTSGAFASHVRVSAALVFELPDTLSFAQAAAVPTAYATAHYSLVTLGRIQGGERILIHAATGGVGLAAISVAKKHGAIVIATAGSPEKRSYLHRIGIEHVFDSRSLGFADDVLAATDGYGVDLVLNSLPGPFLEKGLSLLASGGRFLEIGKRDIYADTPIGLRVLRRNASFFAIDLARLADERPDALRRELERVFADLDRGVLDPLPVEMFPVARVTDAFRHMAKARHIGKIVVTYGSELPAPMIETDRGVGKVVASNMAYLVTGGLRGFGLAVAQWLVENGARHLVLVSRTGAVTPEAFAAVEEMRAQGAQIVPLAADVAVYDDMQAVIDRVKALGVPLRGIIHAAGVIDDALVPQLELDKIRRVFEPKVLGAWHLHDLTRDATLDFFVCFSSVAAHLGSVGQSHYAGANRALEAFAEFRRAQGLPGLSIAWGAIGDTGYLAHHADVARYLSQTGVNQIPIRAALSGLGMLLARDCNKVVFADVRWPLLARANPNLAHCARIVDLIGADPNESKSGQYLRAKLQATPESNRQPIIVDFLREQIATVLKVSSESVELERPLSDIGLDSLTSFELKNRVEAQLGMTLAIGAFLQRPTARDLSKAILEKIDAPTADVAESAASGSNDSDPVMSIGQESLWYVEHVAPGSPAYGLAMCIAMRPHIDAAGLTNAYQLVVSRLDSLRMVFPADANGPVPIMLDAAAFAVNYRDVTTWTEETVRAEIDRQANRPFDLATGPLVRLHLYRRADNDILLLHVHHIVADASSIVIAVEQILEAYLALRAGAAVRFATPARPYANFAAWQRSVAEGAAGEAHLAFWRQQLADAPPSLPLPTDYTRPPGQRGPGASTKIVIPSSLGRRLAAVAQDQSTTLFTVLLSAFNVLMYRLTGETDVVIGTPVGGRVRPEFEHCVGYLVNPVPIRTQIDATQSFRHLVSNVDATVRAALEHQEFPFARTVRDLELPRDPNRSPVFQVMFAMERSAALDSHGFAVTLLNTEGASINIREFKIEAVATKRDRAQFDLTFILEEFGGEIYGVVDYRTDLWHPKTVERFVAQYESILQAVARSIDAAIPEIAAGSDHSRPIAGPTLDDYDDVCDAIRRAADADPDRIAVEGADGRLSYRALMQQIDSVAGGLAHRGIGSGALVGLCLTRSTYLVSALLGVLEAGASYMPIDVSHPPARLAQIFADAAPSLVITDSHTEAAVRRLTDCPVVLVDALIQSESIAPGGRKRNELAYVIHTSGSTGKPVGVEVRRDSFSSFLAAMATELPLSSEDTLLAVTTIAFDIAGLELILPLTLGARVVIADEQTVRDGKRLAARIGAGGITSMQATPATWQMLLEAGWGGQRAFTAMVGGERLPRALADALLDRIGTLWNLYGPTETTIWSTCAQVSADSAAVPIGRPIANTTCYVVDERLKCVPAGVPGELLIGGRGVARGYMNDPERTVTRFVPDPFDPSGQARCFRTGDYVKLDQDGALLFLGRRDQQVKVRGFRVELGDIEASLGSHPAVRAAVALLHGAELADTHVAAYATVDPTATIDERGLLEHLRATLPAYMVPASVTIVEALPRLPNGKIDRARLRAAAASSASRRMPVVEPRNAVEEKLLVLLKDLLGSSNIGIEDHFFEIGGTSLLGMRYLARVSDVFNVELGPGDLMRAATVASLAECIAEKSMAATTVVPTLPVQASALPDSFWRPLPLARAEGAFARVDAAAIAYLPDEIVASPLFKETFGKGGSQHLPTHWTGLGHLSFGTIALLVVPSGTRDFFADPAMAITRVNAAIVEAHRLGATCVSLTGLIPAVTDLGEALATTDDVALTTGHAATAGAMGLTLQSALSATRRNIRQQHLCFVGLGAIGTATLRTALGCLRHPGALTLCDVPAKKDYLEALAREARKTFGFRGAIDVVSTSGTLPLNAYEADMFVGATNVPKVIDIDELKPGSIIVDDSFPLCFDFAAAQRRFAQSGDILFVSGGSVSVPDGVRWDLALPNNVPGFARRQVAKYLLPPNDMITGCILSALLPRVQQLRSTIGSVTLDDCRAHWDGFAQLGIEAAPLHCGPWFPTKVDLERFTTVPTIVAAK